MPTNVTPDDLPRIATTGRLAGELLDAWGPTLLELAQSWAPGPAAANLDPDGHGGNRYDEDGAPIPSDPTGEAAITRDQDYNLAVSVHHLLRLYAKVSTEIRDTIMGLVTTSAPPADPTTWCSHHLRIGITEPRHRGDLCRWCYDFKNLHRVLPPLVLLGRRHLGKHISTAMIEAALEAEGHRLEQLGDTTKAIRKARGRTGRPDQNRKQKAS